MGNRQPLEDNPAERWMQAWMRGDREKAERMLNNPLMFENNAVKRLIERLRDTFLDPAAESSSQAAGSALQTFGNTQTLPWQLSTELRLSRETQEEVMQRVRSVRAIAFGDRPPLS